MSKLERRQHSFLLRASSPLSLNRIQPSESKPVKSIISKLKRYHNTHQLFPPIFLQEIPNSLHHSIIAGHQIYLAAKDIQAAQVRMVSFSETPPTPSLFLRIFYYIYPYLEPIERGQIFQTLLKNGYTQKQLSEHIGIGRSSISHYTNLLKLPKQLKKALNQQSLSISQAKEICCLTDIEMELASQKIISERPTIYQLRQWVSEIRSTRLKTPLEIQLRQRLGAKIKIKTTPEGGKSELSIRFESIEQLKSFAEDLLEVLPKQQNESSSLYSDRHLS